VICGGGGAGIVDASLLASVGLRSEARGRRIAEADIMPLCRAILMFGVVWYALCEREEVYSM
jgi:hypothetical protein